LNAAHLKRTESRTVQDIKFYLNNPSTDNWRKLHELLIPEKLANKEVEYWQEASNSNEELGEIDSIINELRRANDIDIIESNINDNNTNTLHIEVETYATQNVIYQT
jgi:hypothetical protein